MFRILDQVYLGTAAPAAGGGGITPTGTLDINANGSYNVYNYAEANVSVLPNVTGLDITPSTSAQSFVATGGLDGYSPVNVSAVTASIDSNITASNIVNGVNILGVVGTASASAPKEVAKYVIRDNGVVEVSDADVTGKFDDILNIKDDALRYAFMRTNIQGNATFPNCISIGNMGLYDAFWSSKVSGNISFEKCTEVKNSALFEAYAGSLIESLSFTNLKEPEGAVPYYNTFAYVCNNCIMLENVNFCNLENTVTGMFLYGFAFCSNLTDANFHNLKYVNDSALRYTFYSCSDLINADISSIINVTQSMAMQGTFSGCSNLKSLDLKSLNLIRGQSAISYAPMACMCENCYNLSYVNFPAKKIGGSGLSRDRYALTNTFANCTNLTTFEFSMLQEVVGLGELLYQAFKNSGIQNLYFPVLSSGYDACFGNMLSYVNGCTVHLPRDMEATMNSWNSVLAGFNGTNTTVLFDMPSVSNNFENFYNIAGNGEMGGQTIAVNASSENADAFLAMNQDLASGWHSTVSEAPHYYTIYCPDGMALTQANFATAVSYATNRPIMINVCVSNDGTNWKETDTAFDWWAIDSVAYTKTDFTHPSYHKYYKFYFNSYQNNPSYLTTINTITLTGTYKYE